MRRPREILRGAFGWTTLTRIRDSLVSKAIGSVTLSAFVLSNFDVLIDRLSDASWRIQGVLIGGLVFVAGYVVCLWRAPAEFRSGHDIPTLVSHMLQVSTAEFFDSRTAMLRRLVEDIDDGRADRFPLDKLLYAKNRLAAAGGADWRELAGSLYDADLRLRDFADMPGRAACAALFGVGLFLIALPTLVSVIEGIARIALG